jgi:hypothetical protein
MCYLRYGEVCTRSPDSLDSFAILQKSENMDNTKSLDGQCRNQEINLDADIYEGG